MQSIKGAVRKVEGMLTTLNRQSTKSDPTVSKLIDNSQDKVQNNGHQEEQSDQSLCSQSLINEKNNKEVREQRSDIRVCILLCIYHLNDNFALKEILF